VDTYIQSGETLEAAWQRTSHLAIGAHQDDLEIMAVAGILECYGDPKQGFMGVVVTNGAQSARSGPYANHTDAEMAQVRSAEQRHAAEIGKYAALVQLNYPSAEIKHPERRAGLREDLHALFGHVRPKTVYTHSLFDTHATHRAVALAVIEVLRELGPERTPAAVLGCEVWQDLDWLPPEARVSLDVSAAPELQEQLLSVFHSQIAGGKRYDLAALGRRRAHATFGESHQVDAASGIVYAMDLLPLLHNPLLSFTEYLSLLCDRHRERSIAQLQSMLHVPPSAES